jgi:hypothetical protein
MMMKKVSFIFGVLLSCSMFCACSNSDEEFNEKSIVSDGTIIAIGDSGLPEDSLISQNSAWVIVKSLVLNNKLDGKEIFVSKDIVRPNSTIETCSTPDTSPNFPSWIFFIDDNTMANWSHPCRYVYVNAKGGNYEVHQHSMPPLIGEYGKEELFIILVHANRE